MNHQDLLFFTKHLGVMLKAGIPLVEALNTLVEQARSSNQKKIINALVSAVETGKTLSESLATFPKTFSTMYCNLIEIGEKTGSLEESMTTIVIQQTKSYLLRKKIQSAMMYPLLVLGVTLTLGGAISFLLLPKLADFFTAFTAELPLSTRILLTFASLIKNYGILILFFLVVICALILVLIRIPAVFHRIQTITLRIPIFGKLVVASELAELTRNLATMLKRGIPISAALGLVAETQNNYQYRKLISQSLAAVTNGKSLAETLTDRRLFPVMITRMVAVGEKTGKLDEVLLYLADFMEEEVDSLSKNLSVLVEPVLLFAIGLVVAFTALAIISPIYGLLNYIQ